MATVYILYSPSLEKHYIGSCKELAKRLEEHNSKIYNNKSFTARVNDWELFYVIENLEYLQARQIEAHIKKMKSKKYIQDLVKFPAIAEKLVAAFK